MTNTTSSNQFIDGGFESLDGYLQNWYFDAANSRFLIFKSHESTFHALELLYSKLQSINQIFVIEGGGSLFWVTNIMRSLCAHPGSKIYIFGAASAGVLYMSLSYNKVIIHPTAHYGHSAVGHSKRGNWHSLIEFIKHDYEFEGINREFIRAYVKTIKRNRLRQMFSRVAPADYWFIIPDKLLRIAVKYSNNTKIEDIAFQFKHVYDTFRAEKLKINKSKTKN